MKRETKLLIDFVVVAAIILAAPFLTAFKPLFVTATFYFFILPTAYLLIRKPKNLKRILTSSILIGVILSFIVELVAEVNKAWALPDEALVFGYKILGLVSIDAMIWYFFWTMSLVTFYEHFLEHERSDKLSHNYKYALLTFLIALVAVVTIFLINQNWLLFPYPYFFVGVLSLIPLVYLASKNQEILIKFIKMGAFFFLVYLAFEFVGLKNGLWLFPGQYVGRVEILGVRFPIEEFFFWIIISAPVVLSYHELYVDDER